MTVADLRSFAHPLYDTEGDHKPLLELVGDSRFVLLGEGSHGTHDFYHERAEITKRLIIEKGFNAVAVEADWPDAFRVNRYVRGGGADPNADSGLLGFERVPTWLWRNTVVLAVLERVEKANSERQESRKEGIYGMDL